MAIVENPKIGRARNKLGRTVFFTQWGKNVLRSKPITVKNPKTPAQVKQRMKFKKLMKLLHQVLNYINEAYDDSVPGKSAHSHVMSINLKNCFVENTTSIDPSRFVLCDNDGSFVDNVVLTSTSANTINGTFDSNAQNDEECDDTVKAYGFYAAKNKIWQYQQSATRINGTITLTRPKISGLDIAVYFECLDRINLLKGNPKHVIKYVGMVTVF